MSMRSNQVDFTPVMPISLENLEEGHGLGNASRATKVGLASLMGVTSSDSIPLEDVEEGIGSGLPNVPPVLSPVCVRVGSDVHGKAMRGSVAPAHSQGSDRGGGGLVNPLLSIGSVLGVKQGAAVTPTPPAHSQGSGSGGTLPGPARIHSQGDGSSDIVKQPSALNATLVGGFMAATPTSPTALAERCSSGRGSGCGSARGGGRGCGGGLINPVVRTGSLRDKQDAAATSSPPEALEEGCGGGRAIPAARTRSVQFNGDSAVPYPHPETLEEGSSLSFLNSATINAPTRYMLSSSIPASCNRGGMASARIQEDVSTHNLFDSAADTRPARLAPGLINKGELASVSRQEDVSVRNEGTAYARRQEDASVRKVGVAYALRQEDASVRKGGMVYASRQEDGSVRKGDVAYVHRQEDASVRKGGMAYVSKQEDATVRKGGMAHADRQKNVSVRWGSMQSYKGNAGSMRMNGLEVASQRWQGFHEEVLPKQQHDGGFMLLWWNQLEQLPFLMYVMPALLFLIFVSLTVWGFLHVADKVEACAGHDGLPDAWYIPGILLGCLLSLMASLFLLWALFERRGGRRLGSALYPEESEDGSLGGRRNMDVNSDEAMESGTPAEKMMHLLSDVLQGHHPKMKDVVLIRNAIQEGHDLYQPLDLKNKMAKSLGADVARSLMTQLGQHQDSKDFTHEVGDLGTTHAVGNLGTTQVVTGTSSHLDYQDEQSVHGLEEDLVDLEDDLLQLHRGLEILLVTGVDSGHLERSGPKAVRLLSIQQMAEEVYDSPEEMEFFMNAGVGSVAGSSVHKGSIVSLGISPVLETSVPQPIVSIAETLLASASASWTFDTFHLDEATEGHALSSLAFFLIHQTGILARFKIPAKPLVNFLRKIELGYENNPYHNRIHAADVLQTYNVVLTRGGFMPHYVDPLTHLACLLSAVVHDYEHRGVTNDYLVNSGDDLALLYNDRSPMENHHLAASFRLLKGFGCDFLSHLPKNEMTALRKLMIELVLSTDMKNHFSTTSQFTNVHRLAQTTTVLASHSRPASAAARQLAKDGSPLSFKAMPSVSFKRSPTVLFRKAMSSRIGPSKPTAPREASRSTQSRSFREVGEIEDTVLRPLDEAERILSLQMALKVSDLGHLAETHEINLKWVDRLENEFFSQGDKEKKYGLPVSPLFDRDRPGVTKSQVGFFSYVAVPTFHNFCRVFKSCDTMYFDHLLPNFEYWKKVEEEAKAQALASQGS